MRLPRSRALWALIVAGTVARIAVAFATYGHDFDMGSLALVRDQLGADVLHVYSHVTFDLGGGIEQLRWPYPPGFFAWIAVAGAIDDPLGLPFHGLVQLPAILADAAIAVLVYIFLLARGRGERAAVAGAGLVALGPSFAFVSGYHGQIDSVAILPAVAAVVLWELHPAGRTVAAGLLIGIGAAVKAVPLAMVLALVPSARDRREGLVVAGAAVAVPLLLLVPFLLADYDGASNVFGYSGVPGVAGLSLIVQPDLAADWLTGAAPALSPASRWLYDLGGAPTFVALAAAGLFLLRYRPPAPESALLVWLVVYVFSPNLLLHYAVWGLPFLLLAGHLRAAAAIQAALVVPNVLLYALPWSSRETALIYAPIVTAVWLAAVVGLVVVARRIIAAAGAAEPLRTAPRSA